MLCSNLAKRNIMNFSKQISIGYASYGKAFTILFSGWIWLVFLFPVLLNVLMFFSGLELVDFLTNFVKSEAEKLTSLETVNFFGAGALKWILTGSIWLIFKLLFFVLFSYFGGFLILILLSPVLAWLSEKTEQINTGKSYPFDIPKLFRDIARGVLMAIRNMTIQTLFVLCVFALSLIPVLGWIIGIIGPVFIFLVTSYFYGFSFMDYSNERRKLNISQSVKLLRKYKWVAIANGSILSLVLIVPMCGFGTIISPFVAIVSVVAGSVAMEQIFAIEQQKTS